MDNNAEDVKDIESKFNVCLDRLDNDNIWRGDSKEQLMDTMIEVSASYFGIIAAQMATLSQAYMLFTQYQMKQAELASLQGSLSADLTDDEIASIQSAISTLEAEIKELESSIKSLLAQVVEMKISGATTASGENKGEFVNYYQTDYTDKYGEYTIADAGCGTTSMAMVLTYLTGDEITPIDTSQWSEEHGYVGDGTYFGFFANIADEYELEYTEYRNFKGISETSISEHLKDGDLIIMHMGKGHFTKSGHYIVLTGITEDGKVTVADPNSRKKSEETWDISVFTSETKGNMICFET